MSLELFLAYAATGKTDIRLRNTLVKLNMGLARKEAHKAKQKCSEPYEDLEQVAMLKLIQTVENFDPTKGNAFSSFSVPFLQGCLKQYLRDLGHTIRLSQSIQTLEANGRKAIVTLTHELGRKPTLQEIADRLECKLEDYQEAVAAVRSSRGCVPIDAETEEYLIASNRLEINDEVPAVRELDTSWLKVEEVEALKGRKRVSRREVWERLAFA